MPISCDTRTFARLGLKALPFAAMLLATSSPSLAANEPNQAAKTEACSGDNGGITLPKGFCATVFADNIGHARHMAVGANGVVYVNTWSGRYYGNDTPPPGGFLVALQDINGDGKPTSSPVSVTRFSKGRMAAPASPSTRARSTPK